MAYTKEQLRNIFQQKFDREAWKTIVINIFGANRLRKTPELFTAPDEAEIGYYMGSIDTPDAFHIGLFYYQINTGSVAHKKVGLRNLVKRFINQNWGEFDAAIVVFNDGKEWRLSFVCDIKEEATAPKRFTFVFGEKDNFYRTAIDRFEILQRQEPTFENIRKTFSVEALSDDFFDTYRNLYADFVQYITGKRYVKENNKWVERELSVPNYQFETTFAGDGKLVRDYIKKMFGRIVFLYFLQRKGWLDGNRQYMHDLFVNSDKKDDFLDGVLEPLFFEVLNTDKPYRSEAAKTLPGSENIPYLNGGLFAKDDIDDRTCVFSAEYFSKLFDFLDSYNFTIDENDTDDAEIGIDPEMFGRIFENLLEDNKDKGAFYTPKEIVNYMCRESIIAYLLNGLPQRSHELIRNFVESFNASELNADQRHFIRKKLQAVKICDPAIGSGAFPMGLVNLLSKLYVAMKTDTDTAKMKRHIMEQNIYGVDIEQGAVDIARLRFWLAMIVEEKEPIPLPNLHFKIMQGNSLLESYNGIDLSDLTKVSGQSSLFDSDNAERESLIASLKSYYKTSDHQERDRLFDSIIKNVRRQLFNKNITLPTEEDPSANTDFFLWHTWFTDVFENGGFDIVIGNPPYIKEYTNREAFNGFRETSPYYKGKMDLWYGFACHGIDLLKQGGILSFIATNNWIKSSGASLLRKKIRTDAILAKFIDFGTYMIFGESASIQTMIMFVVKEHSNSYFRTSYIHNLLPISSLKDIENLLKGEADIKSYSKSRIDRADGDKLFSFGNEDVTNICEKLSSKASYLSDGHIAQGIIGAPDEAFIITNPNEFSESDKQYIKPYYTGLTHKYILKPTNKYILYLSAQNFSESAFEKSDNIKSHFEPYKAKLIESKIKFKTPKKPFFFLHRERKEKFFKRGTPRIITQGRSLEPVFAYTEDDCYPSRALFVITSEIFNLKFLCGLLNSKVIKFWLNYKGKMQGACYQIDKGPLLSIPIKTNTLLEKKIIKIVTDILNGDSDIYEKSREIDKLVYNIYELTYDEVLTIDPETPISREEYENFTN